MKNIIVFVLCVSAACSTERSDDGHMGDMGDMGIVGPQGPEGPQGPAGARGPTGSIGAQGPAGPAGASGAQGATGAQGPQGLPGAPGAQGPTGSNGSNGAPGLQGPPGVAGAAGAAGTPGARGPSAFVYSNGGAQLGILLSATPGSESYVSLGDQYTLVPDGLVVPLNHVNQKVWYTNNNCTGTPFAVEGFGYVLNEDYVYVGHNNAMYTAATPVFAPSTVIQSYSTGGIICTGQVIATKVHAMTSVGSPIDPAGSLPWHIVVQ